LGPSRSVFDLALDHTVRVAVPGHRLDVEVARLSALVVLKIVAWLDRPQERQKDLGDLGRVLTSGLDEMDDRRWQPPLADEKFDEQSPVFVGREVSAIARDIHIDRIREFLRRVMDDSQPWTAVMARLAGFVGDDPEAIATRYLFAFERGLKGTGAKSRREGASLRDDTIVRSEMSSRRIKTTLGTRFNGRHSGASHDAIAT
jgi:predicted nucleotidyltransferase